MIIIFQHKILYFGNLFLECAFTETVSCWIIITWLLGGCLGVGYNGEDIGEEF